MVISWVMVDMLYWNARVKTGDDDMCSRKKPCAREEMEKSGLRRARRRAGEGKVLWEREKQDGRSYHRVRGVISVRERAGPWYRPLGASAIVLPT